MHRIPALSRLPGPRRALLVWGIALFGLLGCGEDPFARRWPSNPLVVTLFSRTRPEPFLPSAIDLRGRVIYRIENPSAAGEWDFVVDIEEGEIVIVPGGALGIGDGAEIVPIPDATLESVREAPADASRYIRDAAVPVEMGTVYVVQSHLQAGSLFQPRCVYYAKLEPITIDPEGERFTFVFEVNPFCNDRDLDPNR